MYRVTHFGSTLGSLLPLDRCLTLKFGVEDIVRLQIADRPTMTDLDVVDSMLLKYVCIVHSSQMIRTYSPIQ